MRKALDATPTSGAGLRRPFDIVHVTQSHFPEDPRPRHEAIVARDLVSRVGVIAMQTDPSQRHIAHFGSIAIVRLRASKKRGSALTYLGEYFSFATRAWALVRKDPRFHGAQIIHVHSLPDFLVFAARPARARGARVVLDLHEILPEFTRSKFRGLAGRIVEFLARHVERWSRNQATTTVTVNRPVEQLLRSRLANPRERIVVIHNVPDENEMGPPRPPSEAVREPFRLVYHGTLTPLYGLDVTVTAVAQCLAAGERITYDIYGSGPSLNPLAMQIASGPGRQAIVLAGTIPHKELRSRLTGYDAGLLGTRADKMTQYSLSTKLLEYVHLGLPVVAPRLPAYQRYFPAPALWYYAPDDPIDAARAISELVHASAGRRQARAVMAQLAMRTLTWSAEATRLAELYRDLLNHPR